MEREFGGMARLGGRLTARLTSDLDDLALFNKVQEEANSRQRQATPAAVPIVPTNGEPAASAQTATATGRRFRVSLSFAGEYREYVRRVADQLVLDLGKGRVLYDKYFEGSLPGLGSMSTYPTCIATNRIS